MCDITNSVFMAKGLPRTARCYWTNPPKGKDYTKVSYCGTVQRQSGL